MKTVLGIHYTEGDATQPIGDDNKIIVHICNTLGKWGKGFVLSLSARWQEPEKQYRQWYYDRLDNDFDLGAVQFVPVTEDIVVANIVGQSGIKTHYNKNPVVWDAVKSGLEKVQKRAIETGASIHMPRICCGLGGESWAPVVKLIVNTIDLEKVPVTVYDFRSIRK